MPPDPVLLVKDFNVLITRSRDRIMIKHAIGRCLSPREDDTDHAKDVEWQPTATSVGHLVCIVPVELAAARWTASQPWRP